MDDIHWQKQNGFYVLISNTEALVTFSFKLRKLSEFSIGQNLYSIMRKGFWNPGYYVYANETEVLKLTFGFLEKNGKLQFPDGTLYSVDLQNSGGLQMRFFSGPEEVLVYGIVAVNSRPAIFFNPGTAATDDQNFLILAAFGFYLFCSFMRENFAPDNIPLILKD